MTVLLLLRLRPTSTSKVDTAPQTIKEAAPEAEANEIKEKLEAAGAKVELK